MNNILHQRRTNKFVKTLMGDLYLNLHTHLTPTFFGNFPRKNA